MKPCQARGKADELVLLQDLFYARKDFVFFQPNVIVEQLPQGDHLVVCQPVRVEHFPQVLHAGPDLGVVGKHAHHVGVLIETHMPGQGRQQFVFFFAKVRSPALLPEAQQGLCGLPQSGCPVGCGRSCGPGNLQRLHQDMVVMLAQGTKAEVTLHDSPVSDHAAGTDRNKPTEKRYSTNHRQLQPLARGELAPLMLLPGR